MENLWARSWEFWWPEMSTFVKSYVDGCATCQATKIKPRNQVPLVPNQVPTDVWGVITMDFITDLPVSQWFNLLFMVVGHLSKATIITPCNKTITAKETSKLYMENVWRRIRLPDQVISDRGPQFASKVMQEVWEKLGVKSTMFTAFHPQTNGETEQVNQELEQYFWVFCNFQQDNWVELIPFMEFAHNAWQHSATGRSPFKFWYGFQPEFIPPVNFANKIPTVEECLHTLNQVRSEVTAALKVAAEVMKRSRTSTATHSFKPEDLVWLEGTNVCTTHPKAKLASRYHGPFKALSTWGVNCKLQLPKSWQTHPVFHSSLISSYKETNAHGPNFNRPPSEIVQGEDKHYEVESVLSPRFCLTRKVSCL